MSEEIADRFDWAEARRRLDATARALDETTAPDPDAAARILAARARELARPSEARASRDRAVSLVTFTLAGETYGVEADRVRGVFRLRELAPLPGAGPQMAGLTLWRGELLLVLDLLSDLDEPEPLDDRAWVVAVGDQGASRGLLAGALQDVIAVPEDELTAPDDRGGSKQVQWLAPEMVQVLSVRTILEVGA